MTTLDVRDVPPAERHPKILHAFAALEPGEALELVNDHEPKPLFYEMQAEVAEFDAAGYESEQRSPEEWVARFPKKPATRVRSLDELESTPHANVFPGEEPKTVRLRLAAGERVPAHSHPDRQIVVYLVSGRLALDLDEETLGLEPGDVVRFDGDREVSPRAVTDSTALLVLATRSSEDG
ncbi:DUF2249 domain-containing protein [Haloprofundus halophilus]|uniref:DUF2249 domain-containing protein n=1 Tax=Haloprofundus halophilus TaxID=2283527 RepID=UPI000E4476E7|nr:DUF2249 domain-containing protein [Haloprofundus halophilus]